jgi:hypothetical protein
METALRYRSPEEDTVKQSKYRKATKAIAFAKPGKRKQNRRADPNYLPIRTHGLGVRRRLPADQVVALEEFTIMTAILKLKLGASLRRFPEKCFEAEGIAEYRIEKAWTPEAGYGGTGPKGMPNWWDLAQAARMRSTVIRNTVVRAYGDPAD